MKGILEVKENQRWNGEGMKNRAILVDSR